MYFDTKPCQVCGAEVELRPRDRVGEKVEPDSTPDERVCLNQECATHQADPEQRP